MSNKLLSQHINLVGDGSYEKYDDSSSAAFIWESEDEQSRITNATLVPKNEPSPYRFWSDPYRCELFSILLALISVFDLEQRFHTRYQPITISVDNDSALDMAIVFDGPVFPTDQHYDIIFSIRTVRQQINTPINYSRVQGHRDEDTPYSELTKLEKLNVECNLIAKHTRVHMQNHDDAMPTLSLPFGRIAIYHNNMKIYKYFNTIVINQCYIPRVRQYYCRKYGWNEAAFSSVNWDAVEGAMSRCNPSTAKWVTKFSSGFLGTAKHLTRREYWLDNKCPLCRNCVENNTHIIWCALDGLCTIPTTCFI